MLVMFIKRSRRLLRRHILERLESRIAFDGTASAAAALPWFDPGMLTYSFVPDGTSFGNERSSLFTELADTGSVADWKSEFDRAFNLWLAELGTSTRETPDSGDPFGTLGATQGDPRFGDVRIGAIPLADNAMAEAVPHSIASQGTWAGDIFLNSNAEWTNLQQVFSVALHEFGHVLGLGHSEDPDSPMFFHGVYQTDGPTAEDLRELSAIYDGVTIDSQGGDHEIGSGSEDWNETPQFDFDPDVAIPLQASIAATARYSAEESLSETQSYVLYRLDPIGEIDHAQFLNVVIASAQSQGLVPEAVLFDSSGDPVTTHILHNSNGLLVLQAKDVEPNQIYYVAVTGATTALQNQIGGFQFLAEYGSVALTPTSFATFDLTTDHPIVEQTLKVETSRLTHFLMKAGQAKDRSATSAIWATLIDQNNQVLARIAVNHGESRSAPLVFLQPGEYQIIIESGTSDDSEPTPATVELFVDEVSIDVGPGVVDPSIQPDLSCHIPGVDPTTCIAPEPILTVGDPVYPDPTILPPTPDYPSLPPWDSATWLFWPVVLETALHNNLVEQDVSGDNLVTPIDALIVINALNRQQTSSTQYYLDVNHDNTVTPLDALMVINYLNRNQGSGEGEGSSKMRFVPLSFIEEIRKLKRSPILDASIVDSLFSERFLN